MAQLKKVKDPFGEVNVWPADSRTARVRATILMEPYREGAQTGIALDGSGSMAGLYGVNTSLLSRARLLDNQISPVAQQICAYLARRIDADGGTTCIYWATGPRGAEIEVVGDFTAERVERHVFGPPRNFGTGTRLLPAVKYFAERFADAPWGFYVFLTDGELHDLEEVKEYSRRLARDVEAGRRNPLKFVLVGLGPDVNERQMEELDDLDTGTAIDLWDHKLAAELRVLQQIFAEVVDRNARVAPSGRLLDPAGRVLKDYRGGVPGVLEFEIDRSAEYFTLEVPGQLIHQALSDAVEAPASELLDDSSEPVAEARAPIPTREEAPGAAPGPQPARPEAFEEMGGPPQPEPGSFHPVDEATDVLPDFDLEPPSDDLQIDLRTDEPEERQER